MEYEKSDCDHYPVMFREVLEAFEQMSLEEPKNYLDGTFGRGSHAFGVSKKFPGLHVYALDKDHAALNYALSDWSEPIKNKKFFIEQASFAGLDEIVRQKNWPSRYDMILLDLGLSTPQLNEASRGFSFYQDGPLDMRMDQRTELTAGEIINHWSQEDLISIFKDYGEVIRPQNVVRSILRERKKQVIVSTKKLSDLIEKSVGWRKRGKHPATQYFMALRLVVNKELEDLKEGLEILTRRLTPGGRLAVVAFHSLEDRIVKHFFKNAGGGKPVNKKVIKPTRREQMVNKPSRSARLRVFERAAL